MKFRVKWFEDKALLLLERSSGYSLAIATTPPTVDGASASRLVAGS